MKSVVSIYDESTHGGCLDILWMPLLCAYLRYIRSFSHLHLKQTPQSYKPTTIFISLPHWRYKVISECAVQKKESSKQKQTLHKDRFKYCEAAQSLLKESLPFLDKCSLAAGTRWVFASLLPGLVARGTVEPDHAFHCWRRFWKNSKFSLLYQGQRSEGLWQPHEYLSSPADPESAFHFQCSGRRTAGLQAAKL